MAEEFKDRVTVVKVDIDRLFLVDRTVREQFKIESLPLNLIYKDGLEVARLAGAEQTGKAQMRDALLRALED